MCVGIFFMQCPPPFGACGIGNLIENVLNFIMKKMHLYFLFIILSSCSLFENNPDLCVVHEHGYIWSPGMSFPVTWSYYVCYENISTIECSSKFDSNTSYKYDGDDYASCTEWCDENADGKDCD